MMTTREKFEARRMELANHILDHPHDFDMTTFGYRNNVCGTVACLAGTAALLAEAKGECIIRWSGGLHETQGLAYVSYEDSVLDPDQFAQDYLALPGTELFYNFDLTPETAAKRLLEEPYEE